MPLAGACVYCCGPAPSMGEYNRAGGRAPTPSRFAPPLGTPPPASASHSSTHIHTMYFRAASRLSCDATIPIRGREQRVGNRLDSLAGFARVRKSWRRSGMLTRRGVLNTLSAPHFVPGAKITVGLMGRIDKTTKQATEKFVAGCGVGFVQRARAGQAVFLQAVRQGEDHGGGHGHLEDELRHLRRSPGQAVRPAVARMRQRAPSRLQADMRGTCGVCRREDGCGRGWHRSERTLCDHETLLP